MDLFEPNENGEFKDGEHVLRAKIDMSAANMKMRDPLLYRIRHAHHFRTEDNWIGVFILCNDFAHCLSDLLKGITHQFYILNLKTIERFMIGF